MFAAASAECYKDINTFRAAHLQKPLGKVSADKLLGDKARKTVKELAKDGCILGAKATGQEANPKP